MRILLVEDDTILADGLYRSFGQNGHATDCVSDGHAADEALQKNVYDLVVLDIGLPGQDGFQVLSNLRQRRSDIPVLLLTARDTVEDRVTGLDLGADDYLTKPFSLQELEARIRALIRRRHGITDPIITYGALRFDVSGKRATVNGTPLDLSAKEIAVLEILLLRAGRVVKKEHLIEKIYNWDKAIGQNAVEVCVHRLRKKLEPSGINIRTVRGLGYLLDKHVD